MKEKGASQKVEDLYDSLSRMPMKISAFHKTVRKKINVITYINNYYY